MKKLIYILTFLLSGVAFGQEELLTKEEFVNFKEKVHSFKHSKLDFIVEPTDTIRITNENGKVEKYKLKHSEILVSTVLRWSDDNTDKYAKFGTDFILISLRHENPYWRAIYYYEIIREEEKFLKANVTRYDFDLKKDYEYIKEIEDLGNKVRNNVEIIIDVFRYPRDTFYIHNSLFIIPEQICCSACNQPRALKPEYIKIYKNEKGNIIGISGCGTDETKISFKYNSSDKLKEIKTEYHIYKIEWL